MCDPSNLEINRPAVYYVRICAFNLELSVWCTRYLVLWISSEITNLWYFPRHEEEVISFFQVMEFCQENASARVRIWWSYRSAMSYLGMHHKACKRKVNCKSPFGVLLGWIYVVEFNSTTRILLMLFWKWSSNTSFQNPKCNFLWSNFHSWIIFVNKRSQ
jgi:hypothetical protein